MKELKKGERGFSLIELVIVIALTGLIAAAITTTIFQVFNMNTRTANRMTAVSQVQNAGKIVSEDILQAQSVNATASSGFPLTLTWEEWATNDTHDDLKVVYALVNMPSMPPGGLRRLQRSVTVTPPEGEPTTTVSIVAEYIDPDPTKTSCMPLGVLQPGGVLTFTVTATVGDESETRVYEVKPRPGS